MDSREEAQEASLMEYAVHSTGRGVGGAGVPLLAVKMNLPWPRKWKYAEMWGIFLRLTVTK
jgi:hypothetical protein